MLGLLGLPIAHRSGLSGDRTTTGRGDHLDLLLLLLLDLVDLVDLVFLFLGIRRNREERAGRTAQDARAGHGVADLRGLGRKVRSEAVQQIADVDLIVARGPLDLLEDLRVVVAPLLGQDLPRVHPEPEERGLGCRERTVAHPAADDATRLRTGRTRTPPLRIAALLGLGDGQREGDGGFPVNGLGEGIEVGNDEGHSVSRKKRSCCSE